MTADHRWTLDELVHRATAALAGSAYPGPPNGRVRDVPDRRLVRWYATIGLVDRPEMNGRTALYRTRHLLQVVAVKRLQAEGRSLAEIQAALLGATDETLRDVADLPDEPGDPEAAETPTARARTRFWTERPTTIEPTADSVTALAAVALGGGALLLLPGRTTADDIPAIQADARPLLDLLAERGLLTFDDRSPS